MQVNYLPGAQLDFDESIDWYARRSAVAARRFAAAVDAAIQRVLVNPDGMRFLDRRHQECALKRFPFRIVFRHLPDQILVVAVAHAKRKPRYWRSR